MKGPILRGLAVVSLAAGLVALPQAAQAAGPRTDLKVLVVTNGDPNVEAVLEQLKTQGVPYRTVDLHDSGRPVINAAFLADGTTRAKYQAVVLPNANPFSNAAEMTALVNFEKQFGIRQLDSYVYPTPDVGLNYPTYAGEIDGSTADLTASAKAGAFRYLRGPVKFEDISPTVPETYGFRSTPLPDAAGTHFEPYLTQGGNALAGVFTHDNRSEMVLTFSANSNQTQFRTVGQGIITWLTKGVHLGYNRPYFSVNIDDVFLGDARWSTEANCTPGEGCTDPNVTTRDIRMVPADVDRAVAWQTQQGFTFDLYFNGGGSDEEVAENGSDPLLPKFQADRAKFRWGNHTFEHPYLGCLQDVTVIPWVCQKDGGGNTLWTTKAAIKSQITDNRTWGLLKGFSLQNDELVTGEHSGLKILPQQPQDNPNLAPAANETSVGFLGSDASRDFDQRAIGNALTVPRYPMANYFNTGTAAEMVDEYNWIYTSRANGGSGICEDNPATTTCITPLDPATGYQDHIVPSDARIDMFHILKNDPRPHYVHQANITEGRILYPLLDRILGDYRATFADNSPLVNDRLKDNGSMLRKQAAWQAVQNTATAYQQDGKVVISGAAGAAVPITVPTGTKDVSGLLGDLLGLGTPFGQSYAGEQSGWKAGTTTLAVAATTV
ncbi:MAG: hypothetical protein ABIS86_24710 [Streptosporangiaceae bacterium]